MTNYIIRLKPLTPFFFGGENTFGEGDAQAVNYHVRSNYLPQQTALLGMLRYQLLAQHQLIGTEPGDTWNKLIGERSFTIKDGNKDVQDFGAIKSLSPLFLSNGTDHYLPQALDWTMAKPEPEAKQQQLYPLLLSFNTNGHTDTDTRRSQIPVLTAGCGPYDPKNGTKSLWVKSDGSQMRQWDWEDKKRFDSGKGYGNGFFIEQEQVGIHRKVKKSSSDTGDFYKQAFYRLVDDFAFAFYAQLDLPDGKELQPATVQLGGERSLFAMTVERATNTFNDRFSAQTFTKGHQRQHKAIVLVSDALAPADMMQHCDFAIAEAIPFRNIITKSVQKGGDYTRINGGAIGKQKALYYLLKRGSIFFAADTTNLKGALENKPCYQIGYNHFIEL